MTDPPTHHPTKEIYNMNVQIQTRGGVNGFLNKVKKLHNSLRGGGGIPNGVQYA